MDFQHRVSLPALWAIALLLAAGPAGWARWGGIAPHCRIGPAAGISLDDYTETPLSADGRFLYVPSFASEEVHVYDIASPAAPRLIQRQSTGAGPTQAVLSADGKRLAVLNRVGGSVSIFDVNTHTGRLVLRGTFAPPGAVIYSGNNVALSEDGSKGVVASGGTNVVYSFDADTVGTYTAAISTQDTTGRPHQVVLSRYGGRVLVVCIGGADAVDIFDRNASTGVLTRRGVFRVPGPVGLLNGAVINSSEQFGAVTSSANALYVFDARVAGENTTPFQTFTTPDQPRNPFLSADESRLGVVCRPSIAIYDNSNLAGLMFLSPRGEFAPGGPQNYLATNNLIFDAAGLVAYVAQGYSQRVDAFDATVVGTHSTSVAALATGAGPDHLTASADGRRLALVNADTIDIFDVKVLDASLWRRSSFSPASLDFESTTTPAVSGDGTRGFVIDVPTRTLHSFDASVLGNQAVSFDTETVWTGSRGVSLSPNGQRLAVPAGAAGVVMFFDVDLGLGALTRRGTYSGGDSLNPWALPAWRGDGSAAYQPVQGGGSALALNPLTGAVFDQVSVGGPLLTAMSPEGQRLATTAAGPPPQVALNRVNPDGTLSTQGGFLDALGGWGEFNNPVFSPGGDRVFLADEGRGLLLAIDATQTGNFSTAIDIETPGDNPAGVAISADGLRLGVVVPGENAVAFYDVDPDSGALTAQGTVQEEMGEFAAFNNMALTRDGAVALVGNASTVGYGAIYALDTRRPGYSTVSDALAWYWIANAAGRIALSANDRTLLATEINNLQGDQVHILGLGLGDPPQLTRATLFDLEGTVGGAGDPGDVIALVFDQPIEVVNPTPSAFDFYISNGGSLGSGLTLARAPFAPNTALLTLGAGASGITAPGSVPSLSTFIDIGAFVFDPFIVSALNGQPALDLGRPNVDDSGVDLRQPLQTRTTFIQATLGGIADLPQEQDPDFPDHTFDLHRLEVPAGSLKQDTNFTLGPPTSIYPTPGIPSAFQITSDGPGGPGNLFDPPALLVGEYDPAEVDVAAGQLEYLVRLFQIPGAGGAPVLVPGSQMVNTLEKTVSVPISGLDPAGLGGAAAARTRGAAQGGAGTFATLPVNPVESRTIYIAPGNGSAAATIALALADAVPTLTGGTSSAYTLHRVEFPGYEETTVSDPNRIQVTIRTATLFERTSFSGGQSFPTQSGAIFALQATSASGAPLAFTDPVNLSVQFVERSEDSETDTVTFDGVRGQAVQMRPVHDVSAGTAVNFAFVDGDPSIDVASQVLTLTGLTGLTGSDGLGVFGAVIDPSAPTSVSREQLIQHLLGQITLTQIEQALADFNGDQRLDVADIVWDVNP